MTNIKRNIIYSFLLAIVLFLIVPSAKSYASGLSTNKEYYITSAQYSNKVINNYVYNSSDIKNGTYKVAIGDINGGNAQGAIIASNFALGGDLTNLDPAIEFWTEMAKAGRINSLDIVQQNFETGEVPVGVVWSFTGIPYSKNITNYKMVANVPTDGAILNGYASVINKYAPHPCAAALTREVMFSDEGQTFLANAGGVPTRTDVQIEGYDPSAYANAIPMTDPTAYAAACEELVTRWSEEVLPLINE